MVDRHKVLEADTSKSREKEKEREIKRKKERKRKKLISRTKCMVPPSFPYISFWV
jgi:hypothetical protein